MEVRVPYRAAAPALITLGPDATPFRVIPIKFLAIALNRLALRPVVMSSNPIDIDAILMG